MLKKSLMIGVVAIMALVAFSAVMVSDDSEGAKAVITVNNEDKNIPYKGTTRYDSATMEEKGLVYYDFGTQTRNDLSDTWQYVDKDRNPYTYVAFVSGGSIIGKDNGKNGNLYYGEAELRIEKELVYKGNTYTVVGIRDNAFQASLSPDESGEKLVDGNGVPIGRLNHNITKLILPETIVYIGLDNKYELDESSASFSGCLGLKEIVVEGLEPKLKRISGGAFKNTAIKELDLSNCKDLRILTSAFQAETYNHFPLSQLEKLDISSVIEVGSNAFKGVDNITEIVMPKGPATIDGTAFSMKFYYEENGSLIEYTTSELVGRSFKISPVYGKMTEAYVATWDANGGEAPGDKVLFEGEDLPTPSARSGYDFVGWKDSGGNLRTTMPSNNETFTAVWAVDKPMSKGLDYNGSIQTAYADTDAYNVSGEYEGKDVKAGGYSVTFTLKDNYEWNDGTSDPLTISWEIAPKELTVTGLAVAAKTYDGYTDATVTGGVLSGIIGSDTVSINLIAGAFADKNAGTNKDVTVVIELEGADAKNYFVRDQTIKGTINQLAASLSWLNLPTFYNGQEQCPTATVSNLVPGDSCDVTVTGGKINVGVYVATATDLSNSNYRLTFDNYCDFCIAPVEAILSWSNDPLIYNGQEQCPTATVTNLIGSDVCDVDVIGGAVDAGWHTATALFLDNSNYKLPSNHDYGFFIEQLEAILSWSNDSLIYNGQEQCPTATVTNLIGSDVCTVTVNAIGSGVGAGWHTASAAFLSNLNYKLPVDPTHVFTIEQLEAVLSWSDDSLTYNGYLQIPFATVANLIGNDTCIVDIVGGQVKVGDYIATATDLSNLNYKLPSDTEHPWSITKATITVSGITAENKVYNGNTEAVLNYLGAVLDGVFTGDIVELISATGSFADKNVGNNKVVTIGNYVLGGADKDNYVLTSQSMTAVASITPATITVSGITASDKVFDGKVSATIDESSMVFDGKIGNDEIIVGAVGEFVDRNVGNAKTVNIALGLEGADAGNYVLASYTMVLTASISPATITGDIEQDGSLTYDGTPLRADVYTTLVAVADEKITITYSLATDGAYSSAVPSFTEVGDHTVYYRAEAPNHEVKTGSFIVTISAPHNADVEGGDHALLLLIGGIVAVVGVIATPFIFGRH